MDELKNAIIAVSDARDAYEKATSNVSAMRDYAEWRAVRSEAETVLVEQLRSAGAVIRDSGEVSAFRLADIRSTSTCGLLGALGNWQRAASAKFAKMEAGHG